MSDEYGNDFITLTDEEGNEIELEHLDTLEHEDETYMAFIPVYDSADDLLEDSAELIILKVEESDGEELLVTLDNEDLLEEIFEMFVTRLEDEMEIEGDPDFSDDE